VVDSYTKQLASKTSYTPSVGDDWPEGEPSTSAEAFDILATREGVNDHDLLIGVSADDHHNRDHATRHTDGNDDVQDATANQKGLATAAQITKLDGVADGADVTGSNPPQAHKDTHDPEDGSDPLDTAAPTDIGTANAKGSAHSLARSDHVHKIPDKWRTETFYIEVPDPDGTEEFGTRAYFPDAATLTEVRVQVDAATSATFDLEERSRDTPDVAGTPISAASITATTTPTNVTMNNTAMAANTQLVYVGHSVVGTPGKVRIHGKYLVD
jgi:hypothetical protein